MDEGGAANGPAPTRDVGLGTAYERWAIARRVGVWCTPTPRTAIEGPVDGFAGIAGLHLVGLAARGTRVTVVSPTREAARVVRRIYERARLVDRLESIVGEAPAGHWEVTLSFNELPVSGDWRAALRGQLARADRLLLFVTNRSSWGALGCRARDRALGRSGAALYSHDATRLSTLEAELDRRGHVLDRAWVDAPWWPDLFVSTGQTLMSGLVGSRPRSRHVYDAESWPWIAEGARVAQAFRGHPRFETAPSWLGRTFAHHRAFLVTPK